MVAKDIVRQSITLIPVYLLYLLYGISVGWLSCELYQLQNFGILTPEEFSWVAAFHYMTRGLGPIITFPLMDYMGRSRVLHICSFVMFVSWIPILFWNTVLVLSAVRLFLGLALGTVQLVGPVYTAEITSHRVRGNIISFTNLGLFVGELLVFVLAALLPYHTVNIVIVVLAFITIISTLLLREPAQLLILKGRMEEATTNYVWFNGGCMDEQAFKHFEDMKSNMLEEKAKTSLGDLLSSSNIKSLRINLVISLLIMGTGFSAIKAFVGTVLIFDSFMRLKYMIVILGVFQLLGAICASFITDLLNRRFMFCLGCAISAIVNGIVAALYVLSGFYNIPHFPLWLFICFTVYSTIFATLMGSIFMTIRGEILPQSVKAFGSAISAVVSSAISFISVKMFFTWSKLYGDASNFILFSIISIALLFYVYLDMPDTRGKTLTEIQSDLKTTRVLNNYRK